MTTDEVKAPAADAPKADAKPEAQPTSEMLYGKDTEQAKPEAKAEAKPEAKAESKAEAPKTDEPKPDADKPKEEPKFDLKLGKDSPLNETHVEKIVALAKAQGLSQEQAQALLDRESDLMSEFKEAQVEQLESAKAQWLTQVQKDPEISGKENAEFAKRVVDRFGSDEFKKAVNESGLGNHPELVRVFVRIGKAMADDKLVQPGAQAVGKRSMEDIFYGAKQ